MGKKTTITGIYVNSVAFDFKQNDNCSTTWGFGADGLYYENYSVAASGVVGEKNYHCVDPLTWDEVHIWDGYNSVILTGVQNATFSATLNRTEIFQIGQFTPFDRAVVHPYQVSVSMNTLANEVNLTNWWDKFVPSYDPMTDCAGSGLSITVYTQSIANGQGGTSHPFLTATNLRPTTSTLNTAVGANATVNLTWNGTNLKW